MTRPLKIIELAPAYVWDCDECGRENFQRSVTTRLNPDDPDDADVIRDLEGLGPDEEIDRDPNIRRTVQHRPSRVTCRHCGAEFGAVDSGEPDTPDPEDEE